MTAPLLQRNLAVSPEVLLHLASRHPERYPVLFDSASQGPLARHTVLVACDGHSLELDRDGGLTRDGTVPFAGARRSFLDALEQWWRASAIEMTASPSGSAPWRGGFAVFLGYEIITKKRANERIETMVHTVGLVFLLCMIALVTLRDVAG